MALALDVGLGSCDLVGAKGKTSQGGPFFRQGNGVSVGTSRPVSAPCPASVRPPLTAVDALPDTELWSRDS